MLSRCREALKGYEHRDSFYAYSSVVAFYSIFVTLIGLGFYTGSYYIAAMLGAIMAIGLISIYITYICIVYNMS